MPITLFSAKLRLMKIQAHKNDYPNKYVPLQSKYYFLKLLWFSEEF